MLRDYLKHILDYRISKAIPEKILESSVIAAKQSPLENRDGYYIIPSVTCAESMPIPPTELWEAYGRTAEEYLYWGQEHTTTMLKILGGQSFKRVLDFGCAAGRMLRFFPRSEESELWGVDIKPRSILWAEQHLSPPLLFATTTTFPHLPFEDNYFDLVYAGSVFTHISNLADSWFLELRRVTQRGGRLFITIQDKHSLEFVLRKDNGRDDLRHFAGILSEFDRKTSVLNQDYSYFSYNYGSWEGMPVAQVFYNLDYLTNKWGRFAELVSVTKEGYGHQTALVFRKRD